MNLQNFLKKLPLVYLLFGLNTSLFSSSLDADKHKELDYQVKATSEFQSITKPAIDEAMASHATSKRKEADDLEKQGKYQQAAQIREEAKDWETGGKYRQAVDSITNAVGLALGGKPTEGVIAGAASPYINEQIKKATEHHPELNIPAHMIWGAIEAELQGGKATSGAVAAGVGEAGAHYLTQALYGTDNPETLTEAQKKTIADLSKVAGGVAAGLSSVASGGNSLTIASSVSDGMGIAESAVENNYLLVDYSNLKGLVKTDTEQGQKINEKLEKAGVANIDDYAAQYRACGANESCQKQVVMAEMQAISRSYDIIDELAKSGELSKKDIDFIQSTLVPRARGAFDSKAKDKTAQEIYRAGNLETFAKYEQRLTEARFSAQLKEWIDSGLTDSQILKKIEDEPIKIALSTAGPSVNGKQPSGGGRVIPSVGNIKQALAQIREKGKKLGDFTTQAPNAVSGKDRQVTATAPTNYENQTANLKVSTGAEDVNQYLKLKSSLVGKEISDGHAFSKHVVKQGEFKNVNVSTREEFEKHIEHVVNNYTSFKELSNGRSAYWHEASGTVVIRNPKAKDGGTAFQPKDGRKYFDEKLK